MLRSGTDVQNAYELVCIEELVPADHLLRYIHAHIDFSFILEKVKPFYCENNGRPSEDPVRLFKMMLIGYFFGVRSERRLEKEVRVNMAYRWFLGLGIKDPVPDHSTLSLSRNLHANVNEESSSISWYIRNQCRSLCLAHHFVSLLEKAGRPASRSILPM